MALKAHFEMLARYNQWMNTSLYVAASQLPDQALAQDRGAFFGSILGTLNHLVVADTLWLKRFAAHPSAVDALQAVVELPRPEHLDQIVFEDWKALSARRSWLDDQIILWIDKLHDDDFTTTLCYANSKGVVFRKRYASLLLHFFNHQTHHRGQVTTLLSQAGGEAGVTDLLALISDEAAPG